MQDLTLATRVVERSTPWHLGEAQHLRTCSAEDLIIMKAFAGRDRDWADITGILERQGSRLDLALIRRELQPLLAAKEAPELGVELERRMQRSRGANNHHRTRATVNPRPAALHR